MDSEKLQIFVKQFLPPAIMAILAIGIGFLGFLKKGSIETLEEELSSVQNERTRLSRIITAGRGLEDDLEVLKQFEERLAPRLMVFSQFDTIASVADRQRVISYFNREVEDAVGFRPRSVNMTPGPLDRMNYYRTLRFDIELAGNLDEVARFFYHLEASEYLLRWNSFSLRPSGGEREPELVLNARLQSLAQRPER